MEEFYIQIRTVHIRAVTASGLLFALRGGAFNLPGQGLADPTAVMDPRDHPADSRADADDGGAPPAVVSRSSSPGLAEDA